MLIHEVMLEWLKWGNTEIPVCQLTTATILDSSWLGAEGRQGIILENLLHVRSFENGLQNSKPCVDVCDVHSNSVGCWSCQAEFSD